ncbi:MAG: RHS repeat-associated core domain-containing protein [Polyangiaceae bacterium]|nr:RHS repeat-associated core domain-containing protein [Polyangiaceae bacterium]
MTWAPSSSPSGAPSADADRTSGPPTDPSPCRARAHCRTIGVVLVAAVPVARSRVPNAPAGVRASAARSPRKRAPARAAGARRELALAHRNVRAIARGRRLGATRTTWRETASVARLPHFAREIASGEILYEEYHPYGTSAYRSARSGVEVSARRYRNTGKERDEETGFYHGARYYAAWLGRWTSADPLGIGADGPGLYNYTRGSPIVYSDPSGTDSVDEQAALSAAHQQLAEQEYHRYLAEQYVQHDLETGQTIDPSIGVEVPEAVHPQVAFANEMLANIDARLAAERTDALTGEGGASSGLAEMQARDPFAGASGWLGAAERDRPDDRRRETGFWQTLGGAYLGARVPSGPAHAVGALTLASAESHDDPSFVLGTMAVLPGMPAVSQALDRAAGAAADFAYQSAFVFAGVGWGWHRKPTQEISTIRTDLVRFTQSSANQRLRTGENINDVIGALQGPGERRWRRALSPIRIFRTERSAPPGQQAV